MKKIIYGEINNSAYQSIKIANDHAKITMKLIPKLIRTAIHHYKHEWES